MSNVIKFSGAIATKQGYFMYMTINGIELMAEGDTKDEVRHDLENQISEMEENERQAYAEFFGVAV